MVRVLAVVLAGVLVLPAVAQDKGYSALVAKAKKSISRDLKDPDAAKFRDIGIYKSTTGKGGVSVCGEINAKNSYGAYVGFRKFLVSDDIAIIDGAEGGLSYDSLGPALCHERIASVK